LLFLLPSSLVLDIVLMSRRIVGILITAFVFFDNYLL